MRQEGQKKPHFLNVYTHAKYVYSSVLLKYDWHKNVEELIHVFSYVLSYIYKHFPLQSYEIW